MSEPTEVATLPAVLDDTQPVHMNGNADHPEDGEDSADSDEDASKPVNGAGLS